MKLQFSLFFSILALLCIGFLHILYNRYHYLISSSFNNKTSEVAEHLINRTTTIPIHTEQNQLQNSVYAPSKYAYITLLHGVDKTNRYKGFLLNTIIMKKSLDKLGCKADFIVMIGFTYSDEKKLSDILDDIKLLENFNIKLYFLPRILEQTINPIINFAEMALLKITPWSLVQYEKIQYLDGDIMPIKNMDCYFELKVNTFNTGNASPLNSGWFLAIPNITDYQKMREKAVLRLTHKWNTKLGWGNTIPKHALKFRNGHFVKKWDFNGASLDQGLLTDYFVLKEGRSMLLDVKEASLFAPNFAISRESIDNVLTCCDGYPPIDTFLHFTGKSKPWINGDSSNVKRKGVKLWLNRLDELNLPINSSSLRSSGLPLNSPLGYFHPNK